MPVGPVRHLVRWLESAGCVILEEDFGTARVDGLSQWIDDHPVILINGVAPVDRKRLTLAHELGHLVLHNGLGSIEAEGEATSFAAEFLMPAHVIKPELRPATVGRFRDLKLAWAVSMQALCERAHTLGVLSAEGRTTFYKTMNARGWRMSEPGSDLLAPEAPQLVAAIGDALRGKGLSDAEITSLAGFAEDSVDNPFGRPRRLQAI
jgi:Zn-dependent peptidase ImmA (M78 family)